MRKPNILHIDDDLSFSNMVRMMLGLDFDDLLFDTADTRKEAFRKLHVNSQHPTGGYNVVLLDGNLSPEREDGEDARVLLRYIGRLQLPVTVIGFSSLPMRDYGIELEHDLPKVGVGCLNGIISDLNSVQKPFHLPESM